MPKPRGQLGKYGNITHSLNGYREWQNSFRSKLRSLHPKPFGDIFGLVYLIAIAEGTKGHPPDLDNLEGAINDALVPHWIRDDNVKVLANVAKRAIVAPQHYLKLIVCYNEDEYVNAGVGLYPNSLISKLINK